MAGAVYALLAAHNLRSRAALSAGSSSTSSDGVWSTIGVLTDDRSGTDDCCCEKCRIVREWAAPPLPAAGPVGPHPPLIWCWRTASWMLHLLALLVTLWVGVSEEVLVVFSGGWLWRGGGVAGAHAHGRRGLTDGEPREVAASSA
jgi:hypothetical protein